MRKLATQHGVDLGSITGTGVGGRIRKQDVLDAAEAAKAPAEPAPAAQPAAPPQPPRPPLPRRSGGPASVSPKRGTREKMTRLRKVIATRMVESLQVSAQLTTVVEVDLTKVARLRARSKSDFEAREGTKLSFLPFLALAATEALKAHPMVNASIEGDEVVYHGSENLSIAVDTEKGLIVPVVKNAGDLNIAGLARAIADVAARTRNNKITPDDLAGGTFTITNTGSRGALFDTPIINQPQVGHPRHRRDRQAARGRHRRRRRRDHRDPVDDVPRAVLRPPHRRRCRRRAVPRHDEGPARRGPVRGLRSTA